MNTTSKSSTFWKTAFSYGTPAGLLVISIMIGGFAVFGYDSSAGSQTFGFLLMFFVLSLIFIGIKRFRDQEQGGVIKLSNALLLGLAMSFFAALAYVLVWEVYTAVTNNSFIVSYTDHLVEVQKAKGINGEALAEYIQKMDDIRTNYAKRWYRMGITFVEIFPMGFIVTLVSALTLHRPKFWARKSV